MKVSHKITTDEIKNWGKGDTITITAGTGAGKSYFIKNELYDYAKKNNKKILMLIHRINCINQFQIEIEEDDKTDIIEIKTYQSIESQLRKGLNFNFNKYDYIICDEFHYFMSDARFNRFTDMSLNIILGQTNKTRIFMSATGSDMKKYINDYKKVESINYELPIDFSFINKLHFYNKDETLNDFIEDIIKTNQKAIFFIQSAEKAYNLHKKYKKHSLFNCSKSNAKYYKFVDEETINNMLKEEKFIEQILITTSAMDAGLNIVDEDLKYIIVDMEDTGTLIQCIGRKRFTYKNEKINLYVKAVNNQQLGGKITQINKRIEMAEYLKKEGVQSFTLKYYREHDLSNIIYDEITDDENRSVKKINELIFFKAEIDKKEVLEMLELKRFSYCKYIARMFGIDENDYYFFEQEQGKQSLEDYLNSIVGEKLFKDEQQELIERIDVKVNGRQQRSLKKLNEGLEMIEMNYVIIKNVDYRRILVDGTENPNRNKAYWQIIESLA